MNYESLKDKELYSFNSYELIKEKKNLFFSYFLIFFINLL